MNDQLKRCQPVRRGRRRGSARRRAEDQELARLARALSHPARVELLRILTDRETCICGELVGRLPLAQSTVSEHLRILKEAGLVRSRSIGQCTCYELNAGALERFKLLAGEL